MTIEHEVNGKTLTVKLIGELDEASATKLRYDLDKLIEGGKCYEVIFDFKDVAFMDSTGIGIILGRYKKLSKSGIDMYISNTSPQVEKVFTTSGIYGIIKKVER
jgi:anti-anti-sigma factor